MTITISAIVGYVLLIFNIIAIITVIFFQRKEPSTRFTWILILSLFPVVGFILYLLIGHNYVRKRRIAFSESATRQLRATIEQQVNAIKSIGQTTASRYQNLIHMNLKTDNAFITNDNSIQVFTDGLSKYKSLLNDIKNAQEYIHVEYFIFRSDSVGKPIIAALAEKAANGVEVKVVYDGVGNIIVRDHDFYKIRDAGGMVYRYSPILTAGLSANYRNHRKIVVIDDHIGYIGGMNIAREYAYGTKKIKRWRDTHLRIVGSAVHSLEIMFLEDYLYAANKKGTIQGMRKYFHIDQKFDGNIAMQIVSSAPQPDSHNAHSAYIKIISAAEKYVYIQTPYFVPDKTLYDAIRIAALSGVDVRIMIPSQSDKMYIYFASLGFARQLQKAGASIFVYDGFIHAKTIVSDDQVMSIGSANMDERSMYLCFEGNAIIYDEQFAISQRKQFYEDMKLSTLAGKHFFADMPLIHRGLIPICQLISPML